jgi:replicative DNA helicase
LLLEAVDERTGDKTQFMGDLAGLVYDHIERVRQAGGITGIPTGLTDLDRLLGGLQRSDMIVMAGRPGMGKTSLAMQIAKSAAKNHGKRSLFFSLEMSKEQLAQRVVSSETGIEVNRLRTGNIRDEEWNTFFLAQKAMSEYPIAVDDTPSLTPSQLRSKAIRHQARFGLDLIIIDYIQLMATDHREQNRHQEISIISRACKTLARELNIPIIALSQLSREVEKRRDKRPMLSDLRESGAIEADADVVAFLYRDEVYNPDTEFPDVAEIIVAKHRSGPTGVLSVYFKKHLTEFVDLAVRIVNFKQVD